MSKISAVIITYNEEELIGRCLESIKEVADEIVIVDSFSTDRTEEICRKYNTRFIKREFEGYRDQKNFALTLATHQHILSLDADEALSDKLIQSVLDVKKSWKYDGYIFKRRSRFNGKWINHSAWYPDPQLRLFKSGSGKFGELNIHEKFIMSNGSKVVTLNGDLLHWPGDSYEEYVNKIKKYTVIAAEEFHRSGRKANIFTPYIHSGWGFFRSYIVRGGILDGSDGYVICSSYAKSTYQKYVRLRHLNKNGSHIK
jgi:glycosyltransferase involved in cell wall biosynthesis